MAAQEMQELGSGMRCRALFSTKLSRGLLHRDCTPPATVSSCGSTVKTPQNQPGETGTTAPWPPTSTPGPLPPRTYEEKSRQHYDCIMNTTVRFAAHADLHHYSRKRAVQLRGLKEWELTFPSPLSNKAIKVIASSVFPRSLLAQCAWGRRSWLFPLEPSIHTADTHSPLIPPLIHIWHLNTFFKKPFE